MPHIRQLSLKKDLRDYEKNQNFGCLNAAMVQLSKLSVKRKRANFRNMHRGNSWPHLF